jgi:hypothetical protein
VSVRDHDSVITGFGIHDRVVCFQPGYDDGKFQLYMRIDHKWGLGMPTESQMMRVARKDQDVKGRWKLDSVVEWIGFEGHKCTDVFFSRAGAGC